MSKIINKCTHCHVENLGLMERSRDDMGVRDNVFATNGLATNVSRLYGKMFQRKNYRQNVCHFQMPGLSVVYQTQFSL